MKNVVNMSEVYRYGNSMEFQFTDSREWKHEV